MTMPGQAMLSNLDIVTLKHIADAEDDNSPAPPFFVDTIIRLSKAGCIRGDSSRVVIITAIGRETLRSDSRLIDTVRHSHAVVQEKFNGVVGRQPARDQFRQN